MMPSTSKRAPLLRAVDCHRRGDLAAAETIYRDLLSRDPQNPDVLHLSGTLAQQTGRAQQAVDMIGRAVALRADQPDYHYNLANGLRDLGQHEAATENYRRAITLNPQLIEAHLNLGAMLQEDGRSAEAVRCYRGAIQIRDDVASIHSNLGCVLQSEGQVDEAIGCFRRAVELNPDFPQAHCNLAGALRQVGRQQEAATHYERTIELRPASLAAQHNLGQTYHELERTDEAICCYRRALELKPDCFETLVNLGTVYHDLEQYERAIACYEQAKGIRPQDSAAHNNAGRSLHELGRFDEALACFDHALELAPDDPEARMNRALLLLQMGRYADGWCEHEWRWRTARAPRRPRSLPQPAWDGAPLAGRTILIHGEQGVGDEIMHASCFDDVIAQAARCLITCDRRLETLFARSFPRAVVRGVNRGKEDWHALGTDEFDYQVAAGSLPRFLRTTADDFPRRTRYLTADGERQRDWRGRLDELGEGLKVGISWRAGQHSPEVRKRSTTLDDWRGLLATPGAHFVNLQYGSCAHELRLLADEHGLAVHDWPDSDALTDLDGFAAQVAALDLVISVGNATVHLAGALGTPTWCLLPCHWGWRWGHGTVHTPWYASVRLCRQLDAGQWSSLFRRVAADLADRIRGPRASSAVAA